MGKEKEDKPDAAEKGYTEFVDHIDNGRTREAYELLKRNPGIFAYLRPWEIPLYFGELKMSVGERGALYFLARFVKQVNHTLKEVAIEDSLQEGGRNSRVFKGLLDILNIDEEHRKMLEEIGDEDKK